MYNELFILQQHFNYVSASNVRMSRFEINLKINRYLLLAPQKEILKYK